MNSIWLIDLVNFVSVGVWQVMFLAGILVFCFGAVFKKRLTRWIMLLSGIIIACIAALVLSCYAYAGLCCWTCVIKEQPVYAGPSSVYHQVGCLKTGECVCIGQKHGSWVCVEARKMRGWLPL